MPASDGRRVLKNQQGSPLRGALKTLSIATARRSDFGASDQVTNIDVEPPNNDDIHELWCNSRLQRSCADEEGRYLPIRAQLGDEDDLAALHQYKALMALRCKSRSSAALVRLLGRPGRCSIH